jgi:ribosome-binding protein aMBF1 (putative translation factor)
LPRKRATSRRICVLVASRRGVTGRRSCGTSATTPGPSPAFGGRIRAAREAEGLSERELARTLGLDPGTVGAWEGDQVSRPYPRIRRLFERYLALVEGGLLTPSEPPVAEAQAVEEAS